MLRNLSIKTRLGVIAIVGALGLAALGAYSLFEKRTELLSQHQDRLATITALALSIVEARHAEWVNGGLTVEEAQSSAAQAINELRYDGSNYLWINDLDGILVSHPHRAGQIGTSMLGLTDRDGTRIYQEFVSAARAGGGYVSYVGRRPNSDDDALTSPKLAHIALFDEWDWAIGTGVYIDDVDAVFYADVERMLGILVAFLLVTGGFTVLVARTISNGIAGTTETMRRLAKGETELTVPFRNQRDEIGKMANAVEVFRVNAIEKRQLEAEQEEAARRADADKRAAMRKLADDFEESVGHIVQSVSSSATEMRSTAETMSSIAEETSSQATTVASAAEQASANVQTVATATEELGSSIGEISRQMGVQNGAADEAVNAASASDTRIKGLADKVEAIGSVVELITSIAEQTNLLALNATIEAARAGDAGKGFAVVASEVKSLANQTAKATEQIASQIQEVQNQTGDAVESIADINAKIENIREISASVAAAIEEQNAATAEIGRNVQEASVGTQQVSSAIGGVTEASAQAGASADNVLSAAGELSQQAQQLATQVADFMERVRTA